ncbi:MAG: peptidoglycan recognition family protein [Desulfobacteraceae bacterium]|nr:peptidoglycan recognition family protein [Desulfobacteraceae bacterium]
MKPDAIVLHHSATADGKTVSWNAIRRFHTSYKLEGVAIAQDQVYALAHQGAPVERPWSDIGYHFGIELIGDHYEILAGRMMFESGAHCTQSRMNQRALGICFVGNFDSAPPPDAQWQMGLKLVRSLMEIFGVTLGNVYGHRELGAPKSCPGWMFDLHRFRAELPHTQENS